jgi:hypothetical protein
LAIHLVREHYNPDCTAGGGHSTGERVSVRVAEVEMPRGMMIVAVPRGIVPLAAKYRRRLADWVAEDD